MVAAMTAVTLRRPLTRAVPTLLEAADPLSLEGLRAALATGGGVDLVTDPSAAVTAVLSLPEVDEIALLRLQVLRRQYHLRIVVVVDALDDESLLALVEKGVSGVLLRRHASAEDIRDAVAAAGQGDGAMSPALLGQMLSAAGRSRGAANADRSAVAGVTDRERDVLRLLADGHGVAEIAGLLSYSERTIKADVAKVTVRLSARNRTQAVAHAVRIGLI